MANRMEKNSMQTHRFNLKSIVETLKKLVQIISSRYVWSRHYGFLCVRVPRSFVESKVSQFWRQYAVADMH